MLQHLYIFLTYDNISYWHDLRWTLYELVFLIDAAARASTDTYVYMKEGRPVYFRFAARFLELIT